MSLDAFYSTKELQAAGFHSVGDNVRVSRKTSFYGVRGVIGNHVRIDDFCIII